jgi:replicative DNA helicase
LDEHNKIDYLTACGGAAYLSHCIAQCPTTLHSAYYAKIVAKLSFHRRIITLCNTIAGMAYNTGNKTSEIWLKAQEMMYALIQPLEDKQPKRQEPTPIEEIRAAVKQAPPERSKIMSTKEQSQKKQFKGGVSI